MVCAFAKPIRRSSPAKRALGLAAPPLRLEVAGTTEDGEQGNALRVSMDPRLLDAVRDAFPEDPATITLGAPLQGDEYEPAPLVRLSMRMVTRHGLIAGTKESGRSRTVQLIAEQLSNDGVAVFVADGGGELTGLGVMGEPTDEVRLRADQTGIAWKRTACPIEMLSFTGQLGAHARATISSLGPTLLARMLSLTPTQTRSLGAIFRYADAARIPLVDLSDLRPLAERLATDAGIADLEPHGAPTRVSVNAVTRKLLAFEEQGLGACFGEPEIVVVDLLRAPGGRGLVSLLETSDFSETPMVPAVLMLWMLARLYHELPDVPDPDRPRLVFFFEGAKALFEGATKAFAKQVFQLVRVVRSRGIGVFFVVDSPRELPPELIAQLGNRIQHAFVATEPEEEKTLRAIARSYPKSPFYEYEEVLPNLQSGEAIVSALSATGAPIFPVATRLIPPGSRVGPLTERERTLRIQESTQVRKYAQRIDHDAAREALARKMLAGHAAVRTAPVRTEAAPREPGAFEALEPQVGRGLLGAMLGTGPQPRRR